MPNNDCLEDRTPEIVIRKPLCWAPAGSTSFDVCIERLSGGTLNITGGALTATGLAVPSTGATPPTPLAANPCPTGQSAFFWFQDANGDYRPWACLDETTVNPPNSPAGTPEFAYRTWWNDTAQPMPGVKNRFIGVYHAPGFGGTTDSATRDSSAIGAIWDNSVPSAVLDYHQPNTIYSEFLIGTTPNSWAGHAGGEVMGGVFRGSMNIGSGNFTGTPGGATVVANAGGGFSTYSALATRSSATVSSGSCGGGGCFQGFYSYVANLATGSFSSGVMASYTSSAGDFSGCTSCFYAGYHAIPPTSATRFTSGNYGFLTNNFGTNAADYDMFLSGVNSAGTAAGFWTATGPGSLGTNAHAATGYQLDVLGAVKIKAGAGVSLVDLFGSTSGHAGISVAAAAGTPNPMLLPTTTGSSGALLTTDGANPQQLSWNTNLNSVADITATTYKTTTICTNAGGSCAGTRAGMVTIGAAATTVTVTTGGVGGSSQIMVMEDSSLGTALGVTCNTTLGRNYAVTQRTGGVSFVISTDVAPVANPACLSFWIIN